MNRDKLINFINKTLKFEPEKDPWLINGLQVIGSDEVKKVALGVSPRMELFEKAAAWGADMIILHHGLLLTKKGLVINKVLKNRFKILFDNNMTMLTYHLFLDNHETLGNNAQLIKLLGAKKDKQFGFMEKLYWGWEGNFEKPISITTLIQRCKKLCGDSVKVFKSGPEMVSRFGIVTGGGAYILNEAVDKGLDAYLTGEPAEITQAWAKEAGIHFIYLGHYNSEKFGVLALGEFLQKKFPKLEYKFIDIPNPL